MQITLCPEREEYQAFLNDPESSQLAKDDYKKQLKYLTEQYKLAFHNYLAEVYQHLRFEVGEEKVYWNYDSADGVYVEVAHVTAKEWVMKLLIDEGLVANANESFAKTVLARYRACYPERGNAYDDFDKDDTWFHAANGWVNLQTLAFEPHTPERLSRLKSAVPYDATAECPRYDQFLDDDLQLKADQVRVIDQFSGLSLTNDITKQKMLTLLGRPGCGKSTLLDAWGYVVGDMMVEKKLTELQGESMRFAGTQFVGKRLCWFDEVDVKKAEMGNSLGTLITGQHINIERKGVNGIVKAQNTLKCVLTANRLPLTAEVGIYRRLIMVPIEVSFVEMGTQETDIHRTLQSEASGILNRMIRGLQDLQKMGNFTVIEGHDALVEEYKTSSDTVAEFLDEYFEPGKETDIVLTKVMLNTYHRFTEGNSFMRSITPQKFGQLLQTQPLNKFSHIKRGMGRVEGDVARYWSGLKVRDEYTINKNSEVIEEVSESHF